MENLTTERFFADERLRAEVERAARRERARVMKRFLEQSAAALLGRDERAARRAEPCPEPCA
jgi:hypothetical protein